MKGFIYAAVISSAMLSIGNACALDMQPANGRWKTPKCTLSIKPAAKS